MPILVKRFDCVYVRIPKTASTSLVHGLFGKLDRASCQMRTDFTEEWQDKFSFAFVRNPFDRLVSAYLMLKNWQLVTINDVGLRNGLTLQRCLEIASDDSIPLQGRDYLTLCRAHLIPMSNPGFYLDKLKFLGRFENLQADYDHVRAELKLKPEPLPLFRKSQREPYQSYFDESLQAATKTVYAEDLERFGYKFDE